MLCRTYVCGRVRASVIVMTSCSGLCGTLLRHGALTSAPAPPCHLRLCGVQLFSFCGICCCFFFSFTLESGGFRFSLNDISSVSFFWLHGHFRTSYLFGRFLPHACFSTDEVSALGRAAYGTATQVGTRLGNTRLACGENAPIVRVASPHAVQRDRSSGPKHQTIRQQWRCSPHPSNHGRARIPKQDAGRGQHESRKAQNPSGPAAPPS